MTSKFKLPARVRDAVDAIDRTYPWKAKVLREAEPSPDVTRGSYKVQFTMWPPFEESDNPSRAQYLWAARQATRDWREQGANVDQIGFALVVVDKILE